ncbi:MAG: hypothetical protein ACXVYB_00220 [Arthrobacter sp.]
MGGHQLSDTVETFYNKDRTKRVRLEYDMDSSTCDPREDDELVDIVTGNLRRWNVATKDAMFQEAFDRFNEMRRAGLFKRWLKIFHDTEALPVYMLEHGNVSLSTGSFGDPWDSGQIGWTYIRPDAEKWEGMDVPGILSGFVEELGKWMNGEVYGWIAEEKVTGRKVYDDEDEDEEFEEWREGDSCWGFIGYDYAESEAKRELGEES